MRGYRQFALFGSVDFDIIPKVLTVTGGTRWFHYDEFEEGSEFYTESSSPLNLNHPNGACIAAGACGFGINLKKQENGFRSRGNLTWHITPDMMAYYTWSQGFRPGGFNRTATSLSGVVSLSGEAPYHRRRKLDQAVQQAGRLQLRQPDQQRDRLQERVPRSPAAVQCLGLHHELEQRAVRVLRSGPSGQHDLRDQRTELRDQGLRVAVRRPRHRRRSRCRDRAPGTAPARRTRPACSATAPRRPIRRRSGPASRRSTALPYTNPFGTSIRGAGVSRRRWSSTCGRATTSMRPITSRSSRSARTTSAR